MDDTHVTVRWSAYEHDDPERGSDWYWALGILAVCTALTSILFHNVLFGMVIITGAIAMGLVARMPAQLAEIELSDKGIRVGETLHRLEEIISFWVEDGKGERPLLLVDTTKMFSPNLILPIEHIEPALVRAFLKERVPEVPMREPVSHKILEFFGF